MLIVVINILTQKNKGSPEILNKRLIEFFI